MATKQPELPAPSEAAPKNKRVADPELLAINNIAKCMEELDGAAQQRVVSYLNSRYSPATLLERQLDADERRRLGTE